MSRPWRVGRSLGRTLYIQNGGDPKEDTFVGVMDTRDLASTVVAAVNARDNALLNIRTQVLALDHPDYCPSWGGQPCICPIRDVLVMLDREQ